MGLSCIIREATLDDLPSIMLELRKFAKFYGSNKSLYKDDEQTERVISSFITDHVFFVAVIGDELIGFISGMLLPHVYNPDISTLVETFWWVKESHRQSKAALKLLNKFVSRGKELVDWVICTIENDSPVNERSFYKRGFKLKERSFLLEVH